MIDTHCHIDVPAFDQDRHIVIEAAWKAGLVGMVVPAIGPYAWENLAALAKKDTRLAIGLGIHPQYLPELPESEDAAHLERLDDCLRQYQPHAVGECGLDGNITESASMERQVRVFEAHLRLARKYHLPLLVHCLRAHPTLLEVLRNSGDLSFGVLLHSYSGGAELARDYLALGCHFSFAGPVTYERARKPLEAVKAIPADRLMLETDAPDQTPAPFRGQRCQPSFLPHIAEAMARVKNLSTEAFSALTTDNTQRFFRYNF